MKITTKYKQPDTTASLFLEGRFDAHESAEFRDACEKLEADGVSTIVVNLAAVEFVDSTALAELVRGMKRARERSGDLILSDPSDSVRVILELTRLDSAFQII